MKVLSALLMTTLLFGSIATPPAMASDLSGETEAPGQPFVHPSDDMSYSANMRNDERAAAPASEIEAPGQPFVHPSNDMSYSENMRDDERVAKTGPADTQ